MRVITMEIITMLVQVRHDRHPRLQLRRHGELGPGHLQGDLHPRGPRQLLPVQQAVGNDDEICDDNDDDLPSTRLIIISYHGISLWSSMPWPKNLILK